MKTLFLACSFLVCSSVAMATDILSSSCSGFARNDVGGGTRYKISDVNIVVNSKDLLEIVYTNEFGTAKFVEISKQNVDPIGGNLVSVAEVVSQGKANIRVECSKDRNIVDSVALYFHTL